MTRPVLTRSRSEARELIFARISAGQQMLRAPINGKAELDETKRWHDTWHEGNRALLRQLFTTDEFADSYYNRPVWGVLAQQTLAEEARELRADISENVRLLEGVIEQTQFIDEPEGPQPQPMPSALDQLLRLLRRFDRVARRLRTRHAGRPGFQIDDEYDVQDLLGALLRIDFDDVRPEEWTPSYAGGASRIDFLLKAEGIVVEAKKTREGLTDRELGEQLIIDIARYRSHPDCRLLVCFIYDADGRIRNPDGLIADLERLSTDELRVVVVVSPTF